MSATADRSADDGPDLGRTAITVAAAGSMILATVLLLPLFASGSLLHFDLVATPHIEITPGVWGLGPELPRLGPFEIVLAAAARIIGGSAAVTLFLWSSLIGVSAACQVFRRCSRDAEDPEQSERQRHAGPELDAEAPSPRLVPQTARLRSSRRPGFSYCRRGPRSFGWFWCRRLLR